MSYCVVSGCKNRKYKKNCEQEKKEKILYHSFSFHSFPKNNEKRQKWFEALHFNNPPKWGAVCSVHFKEMDYDTNNMRRTLKANAVPFLSEEYSSKLIIHSEENLQHDGADVLVANEQMKIAEVPPSETSNINSGKTHRSTSISPERILNSPTKSRLREIHKREIATLKRNLAVTTYKQKKAKKKICSLQKILKELSKKNLITAEEVNMLQDFNSGTKELIKREIRKRKQLPVSKSYKPSIRQFALTLHYYSPRAYNYVRSKFFNCLPHSKTISKWYRSFSGEPGINSEALDAIRKFANSVPYKLVGTLIFDEMAIRQHLDYCQGKFIGYIDYGNIECDKTKLAKEALVFCIVCINAPWKLPIAYYLVNGISTEQKGNLVTQCLIAVQEAGLLIVSLTCDGLSSNISMLQSLGCNIHTQELTFQPWFKHPTNNSNVYVFLDPCHMVKLVRNALGTVKELYDDTNNIIKWKHIENLHKLQEAEGLHLANKLTTKHIQYHNNKMKVKLATQLLSCSVANAMIICKDKLQISEFADCLPTVKFITLFNDLFDVFNSKNLRQYDFKKPINNDNYVKINQKLQECTDYIKSLSIVEERKNVLKSRLKTGFLGFLINIKSLLHMYKFVCTDNDLLKYIPTYKLSQDHLELIFSNLRSHHGYNNNPTVNQFKSAYKKLIIHTEIQNNNSGNCIPLEDIAILHVTSEQPINLINSTTDTSQWLNVFHIDHNIDHDYLLPTQYSSSITEYKMEVINYIAGFVLKKLTKTLHCTVCLDSLIGQSTDIHVNLINIKNKGPLVYPSHDLTYICKITENAINNFIHRNKTLQHFNIYRFTCRVMQEFTDSNIFAKLKEHINDQNFFSNHRNNLLRGIIIIYCKTRLSHYIKTKQLSERHKYNKLILFKGQ